MVGGGGRRADKMMTGLRVWSPSWVLLRRWWWCGWLEVMGEGDEMVEAV